MDANIIGRTQRKINKLNLPSFDVSDLVKRQRDANKPNGQLTVHPYKKSTRSIKDDKAIPMILNPGVGRIGFSDK